jgi:hypothetical protein
LEDNQKLSSRQIIISPAATAAVKAQAFHSAICISLSLNSNEMEISMLVKKSF